MITFADQCAVLIERLRTRKRDPLKESSITIYKSYAATWIIPYIGKTKLAEFTPAAMREFVTILSASLKPKTVNEIVSFTKQIVSSVRDDQGRPRYPVTFDSDFIDLPKIDPRQQKAPVITREDLERGLTVSGDVCRCLYACLAGSGLRINEALAVLIDDPTGKHSVFDAASSTIHVRRGLFRGREQDSPKTPSAIRSVEIPYALGAMLAKFAGTREGHLFGNGKPISESSARNQLAKLGLPPFHSFRRFFVSHRMANGMPLELIRALVGHSSSDITNRYSRFGTDAAYASQRREWVEKIGLGFSLETKA